MDDRVTNAICKKIDEALVESDGVLTISRAFKLVGIESEADFILGIIIGRIYNSFHYQTRRILGRNATVDEFNEFVRIITARSNEIKDIIKNQ